MDLVQLDPDAPFIAVIEHDGQRRARVAYDVMSTVVELDNLLRATPGAVGRWGVRAEWPRSIRLNGRLRPAPGVPNTSCCSHLFELRPGQWHTGGLTAICGTVLDVGELELANRPVGMPCMKCAFAPMLERR
ncbi:hypothetical protein REH65_33135 (plasmid) [Saccharopolyspora sp. ID03-671]|uniref:hypothetical protein n=1 Tax=Saccharopolyspora sp. ID03-671 TaxID=3073066 RepID=UPI0030F433B3